MPRPGSKSRVQSKMLQVGQRISRRVKCEIWWQDRAGAQKGRFKKTDLLHVCGQYKVKGRGSEGTHCAEGNELFSF